MSKRSAPKRYAALLRKLSQLRKQRNFSAWRKLGKRAVKMRKRMIGRNSKHAPVKMAKKQCLMDSKSKALFNKVIKTKAGKKVAKRFKQFWKIPCPPSVQLIKGGPKATIPLVGMGYTNEVHLSTGDKGECGNKKKVLRGQWTVATEKDGKQVLLLSKRPMSGKLKQVGFAPETHYIPPADVEAAGTHKANTHWRHIHGIDDNKEGIPKSKLKWPPVFADRDGKVDKDSNFVYGKTPTAKITEWMFG